MKDIDENIYQKINEFIIVLKEISETLKEINNSLETIGVNLEKGF